MRALPLSCFLLLLGLFVTPLSAAERPNIILVFIDDMGWGDFSCFGNEAATTENCDRMAAEGIRFTQFYVNSPICSPSRTAISTGQYPQRWKISSYLAHRELNEKRGMAQWLDPSAPMLARMLHNAGYATGHFGKWHMGGQRDVGEAPLITEYGFDDSLTNFEGLGDRVLAELDAYDGKKPKLWTLGSDKLGRGEIFWEKRSLVTQRFVDGAIDFIKEASAKDQPFYVNVWPDDVHSPFFPPKERRGDASKRQLYLGVLETMDEQLGTLFDFVRNDEKLKNNTLIVMCSDNGPELGAGTAGPFRGHKTTLYEGGIRSPLVVWGPGLIASDKAGTTNEQSVFAAYDLVPSLLAVAGVDAPPEANFDGQALPGVILGQSTESHTGPICFRRPPDRPEIQNKQLPDLAVREGKWKLLCSYDGSDVQLYNLDKNKGERKNVAEAHPAIVERLKKTILAWHHEMPADNGADWEPK
ncbi:sulfatase-like hydrolase/transferase [Blastopirellula marina]|uniref:N-acetylgalactosamine-6-sulfatase n=1 Tax=Blastopirellula marina TaxID=124 RepID=A0A2S8GDQ7_9BACT|nr:sulfatase-like hydrolase/transferase [Blastopirellula marina]PQO42586.1 N-acetylgalactosamine-6-sulfatase [Blastopirellula marina]PTL46352.1 N-acetylgalactosamine-6-sulfatase [Blastopirellula marina]